MQAAGGPTSAQVGWRALVVASGGLPRWAPLGVRGGSGGPSPLLADDERRPDQKDEANE